MPRPKKDGRFINYFIDRTIYDRLKAYAEDKGQSMTTALERILSAYLDQYEQSRPAPTGEPRFAGVSFFGDRYNPVFGTYAAACRQASLPQN